MVYRDNRLDPKLDIVGTLEQSQTLDVADESLLYGKIIRSGNGAIISGSTISGLLGITANSEDNYIQLGGVNAGLYKIDTVVSSNSVTVEEVLNNEVTVYWAERAPYSIQDDINYARSDRANIKGVDYDENVPTYVRPSNTSTPIDVNLYNLSGKTTDAKTIILNRKFENQIPGVGQLSILLTSAGNLKHANTTDLTGIPTVENSDALEKCYVEILDNNKSNIFVKAGVSIGHRVFGLTSSSGSSSPDSITIKFFSVIDGGDLSSALPYYWEAGQESIIDLFYPYRERLDLIDENAFRTLLVNGLVTPVDSDNHEFLDTLVHDIAETGYNDVTYIGNKISSIIFWTSSLKVKKVREYQLQYTANKVTRVISIQYDSNGLENSRLTEDVFYDNGLVDYILSNKEGEGQNGSSGSGGGTDGYGMTETDHEKLRQLIHFIDEGPATGFTTGAYKEIVGGIFPTQEIWWESSAKSRKIVQTNITRNSRKQPSTVEWLMYSNNVILATVIDTIQYDGIAETSRTRAIG